MIFSVENIWKYHDIYHDIFVDIYHDIFAWKYQIYIMIYITDIYHWYFRANPGGTSPPQKKKIQKNILEKLIIIYISGIFGQISCKIREHC